MKLMDTETAEQVFRAYRTGLLRSDRSLDQACRPNFDYLLRNALLSRATLHERRNFRNSFRASQNALKLARRGLLEDAHESIRCAYWYLRQHPPDTICSWLATSFLEAAYAYLEYRSGHYNQARAHVFVVMDLDLKIGQDSMFSFFEMHRIQAVDNLLRIDLREGEFERALALAGAILSYVEGGVDSLPVHHSWRPQVLRNVPRSLRAGILTQIANEVALAFPTCPDGEQWRSFSKSLALNGYSADCVHPGVRQWILIRDAYKSKDDSQYLSRLIEFLSAGRRDIGTLWYSCVIDFIEHCRALQSPLGDFVANAILRDASKWPSFPPDFHSSLPMSKAFQAEVPLSGVHCRHEALTV